jgi:hypothetical protein
MEFPSHSEASLKSEISGLHGGEDDILLNRIINYSLVFTNPAHFTLKVHYTVKNARIPRTGQTQFIHQC